MRITASVVLSEAPPPGESIEIAASHIVVDGAGMIIEALGWGDDRSSCRGVGIRAAGCSNVVLRNFVVRGFAIGIAVADGVGWVIEGCDLSDNYTDPDFDWGEYGPAGGIVATGLRASVFRDNVAERVWNGLELTGCDDNLVIGNRFRRCSNVCLRLDRASRNTILENDLSYGRRLRPGEIHARDSTGVLVESGSDRNLFYRNKITHGGDGVFVRVLNGWPPEGNVFVENDCSHAHNNGIEAWAPGNVYVRNRANDCSYGFWLGGSDGALLLGNDASRCAPQGGQKDLPASSHGHSGIVAGGASTDRMVIDGNRCSDNAGAGVVLDGTPRPGRPAFRRRHAVVQENRLEGNGRAVWIREAGVVDLRGNHAHDNTEADRIEKTEVVSSTGPAAAASPRPRAEIFGPRRVYARREAVFRAVARGTAAADARYRWEFDSVGAEGETARHVFAEPGVARVTLTIDNGTWAAMAGAEVYVADPDHEIGTEPETLSAWRWEIEGDGPARGAVHSWADDVAVEGLGSLRIDAGRPGGMRLRGTLPLDPASDVGSADALCFWLRAENANVNEFSGPNPVIEIRSANGVSRFSPRAADGSPVNHLLRWQGPDAGLRWRRLRIPLDGGADWQRDVDGTFDPAGVTEIRLQFEEPGDRPLTMWIDGLRFG